MTSPNSLGVLQRRESHRDSTSRPWNFLEAEFLLDTRITPVDVLYDSVVSPLTTLGTAQQERSMLILCGKGYCSRVEKGVCLYHQNGF